MLLGLINDKNRARPSFTGQRAICPFCKGELIAKCGDIYINHWQHKALSECDSWKENEGEWHKVWKANFPEENQEVIITVGSEKHIADVKTNKGTVIEFQNSSISSNTIAIRENFYGDMVWVVNAALFVENLKIRSVVTHQLKFNENAFANELDDSDAFHDESIQRYKEQIRDDNKKKQSIQWKLDSENSNLKSCLEASQSFDDFYEKLIEKLHLSALFEKVPLRNIHESIPDELKEKYKMCSTEFQSLSNEKAESEKWLDVFAKYSDFNSEEIDYKIIPATVSISSDNFANIYAILKNELSNIFPNVISFRSKTDFDRLKTNPNYYFMAKKVDFEEGRKSKISNLQDQLDLLSQVRTDLNDEIKCIAINQLEACSNACKNRIKELSTEFEKYEEIIGNLKDIIISAEKSKVQDHEVILKTSEFKQKASDIEIKRKYKGLYLFEWKNERKSWKDAQKQIYFDIGKDYLFEIYQEGCLRKIDKQTFINSHLI